MTDLKEQMLKAGLITEDQAKRSTHKQKQQNKKLGREGREQRKRQTQEEARGQAKVQADADRQRGQKQQENQKQKEQKQQGRQREQTTISKALDGGAVANWEGPRTYYFSDGGEIVYLKVTDTAAKMLEGGKAAIVKAKTRSRYTLIVSGAAKELLEAEPARVVTFHQG